MMEEKVYTVKEIAGKENVSIQTVYRWCKDGFLQHDRRPTKRGKGGITISEKAYKTYTGLFKRTE